MSAGAPVHRHRPRHSQLRAWSSCVAPARCRGNGAHGNVTRRDVCGCGAVRELEINQTHDTRSPWRLEHPSEEEVQTG